jgi:hypothetical protein
MDDPKTNDARPAEVDAEYRDRHRSENQDSQHGDHDAPSPGSPAASGRSLYEMLKHRFTRLMMWMGLAAVATYLLDPDRGEERRKGLRKQVNQMRKKGKEIGKKAKLA